jgi:intraflagellar transport protein 172
VIVAQNKMSLCVWYNVDHPGEFTEVETRGLAFDVVRSQKETFILVQDGNIVHQIPLDASRIEFGTAILDGDHLRAMLYLEVSEFKGEKASMWKQLARDAIESKELKIAERACYAAGDIARSV